MWEGSFWKLFRPLFYDMSSRNDTRIIGDWFKEQTKVSEVTGVPLLLHLRGNRGSGLQHFTAEWRRQLLRWWFLSHLSLPFTPKWKNLNLNLIISCYSLVHQILLPEFLASVANCSLLLKSLLSSFRDTHTWPQPQVETTFPSFLCDCGIRWQDSNHRNRLKWHIQVLKRKLLPWPFSFALSHELKHGCRHDSASTVCARLIPKGMQNNKK